MCIVVIFILLISEGAINLMKPYISPIRNPKSEIQNCQSSCIITGAPGTGKTSIIRELSSRGYRGLEEIPRKLLESKTTKELRISPFEDLKEFAHLVFEQMYEQYTFVQKSENICFFDRALPDVLAYLNKANIPIPEDYYKKLNECNFNKDVFICPPWEDIYTVDAIRPYPFEETLQFHAQNRYNIHRVVFQPDRNTKSTNKRES